MSIGLLEENARVDINQRTINHPLGRNNRHTLRGDGTGAIRLVPETDELRVVFRGLLVPIATVAVVLWSTVRKMTHEAKAGR